VTTQIEQDKDFLGNDLSELQKYSSHENLTEKLADATHKKTELAEKNNELSRQMGSLKEQMQQIFDNTHYQRVTDELAQIKSDIVENYDEWLSKKLASDWIKEMLNIATENRYPKMLEKATQYFSLLTNGHYVKIAFEKKDLSVISSAKVRYDVTNYRKPQRFNCIYHYV
jgi:Uncharacterized conserved protein